MGGGATHACTLDICHLLARTVVGWDLCCNCFDDLVVLSFC